MRDEHGYLAGICQLDTTVDPAERRRIWRQAVTTLSGNEIAPAVLERLDPVAVARGVRIALIDGLANDMDWVTSARANIALYQLATILPPGPERRELGRRVLERFRQCDSQSFVQLAERFALGARDAFRETSIRLRLQAELVHCPLNAPHSATLARLALTLLARSDLREAWFHSRAIGSLISRRLASRVVELATRHAVLHAATDRGPLTVLLSSAVRDTWLRLLSDREPLVWKHVATARGLIATFDLGLAADIESDLGSNDPTLWRHGAASLAATLETHGEAARVRISRYVQQLCEQDPGVGRAFLMGLDGAMISQPQIADQLATDIVERCGFDAAYGLVECRRELGDVLPKATATALAGYRAGAWGQRPDASVLFEYTGRELELAHNQSPLGSALFLAREAIRTGDAPAALRFVQLALTEVRHAIDRLDTPELAPNDELALLLDLDRELLTDGMLDVLGTWLAEPDRAERGFPQLLDELEHNLLAKEARPEIIATVPQMTLRVWRLRTLLRLLDRDAGRDAGRDGRDGTRDKGEGRADTRQGGEGANRPARTAAVRLLGERAANESSPLARAVSAALMRAWDALLRDQSLELVDFLYALSSQFDPQHDFSVLSQATRYPEVTALIRHYTALQRAVWKVTGPTDVAACHACLEAGRLLVEQIPVAHSVRTEALRLALSRFFAALSQLVIAPNAIAAARVALPRFTNAAYELSAIFVGSARRLQLPAHGLGIDALADLPGVIERAAAQGDDNIADCVANACEALASALPRALAELSQAILQRLPFMAVRGDASGSIALPTPAPSDSGTMVVALPPWMPLSRTLGGYIVERPLGSGNSGSVFLARRRAANGGLEQPVALKVPDYDSGVARNLSQQEFERMFREEAGALLALPVHPNLARFISFDATAVPKPVLVMEYVRGPTLEQLMDRGAIDTAAAVAIADDIAAGLASMHEARLGHLDLKPANVVLRSTGQGRASGVLVDFGLAGRKLRTGCGSPHYGAPEVWSPNLAGGSPLAADVYAFACLFTELHSRRVLVNAATLQGVLAKHISGAPAKDAYWYFAAQCNEPALAEVIAAALAREASERPSMAELREALARFDHRPGAARAS